MEKARKLFLSFLIFLGSLIFTVETIAMTQDPEDHMNAVIRSQLVRYQKLCGIDRKLQRESKWLRRHAVAGVCESLRNRAQPGRCKFKQHRNTYLTLRARLGLIHREIKKNRRSFEKMLETKETLQNLQTEQDQENQWLQQHNMTEEQCQGVSLLCVLEDNPGRCQLSQHQGNLGWVQARIKSTRDSIH